MSLVDAETGEIIAACTPDEARDLTERIRSAADSLWRLLAEAHDRQAWRALGYDTFKGYVEAEFSMTKQRAYQLLDQARVIAAISEASGSTDVDLNESQARRLKPRLASATTAIADRIADESEPPAPDRLDEIVADVIEEETAKAQEEAEQREQDRREQQDFLDEHRPDDFDEKANKKQVEERGKFVRLCTDLSTLPDPATFIATHGDALVDRHIGPAERAYGWLDEFLRLREEA